ncbi:deoxynucleoside triphosphate triphosphohydrolase SAMHD1-like isoform X2 [Onychostoma macrolepis]|uniref:deoxynucleoside triphosphate triphosphohydrolase SAMHD1-like isoform X1 n=1 Tax=Onychostoma macrolepis TaxID=369639 RepID=UPI00272A9716|nr:deoxynucleoside triphosphate triphosphohydrolase SAMHD1-like isoform X1 [Onychostoma macrolepis]XP_058644408.1 deoxynucleoside triphosphate triphosphohydrolase SAMHD1-like isoform X2 [Onychostoma macrolepis]
MSGSEGTKDVKRRETTEKQKNSSHISKDVMKVVDLDHGMKDKNPIDNVYFYSKRKPNEASKMKVYQLSSFLPNKFNEELVRVYYKQTDGKQKEKKKVEEKKTVEEAEKCFQKWCDSKFGLQ